MGKHWDEKQDKWLISLAGDHSVEEIAHIMCRSYHGIRHRGYQLGLHLTKMHNKDRPRTELQKIVWELSKTKSIKQIMEITGEKYSTVYRLTNQKPS